MADAGRSRFRPLLTWLTLGALFMVAGAARAGLLTDDDDEEAKKPPPEWVVVLPDFPKPENLLPFTTGPMATFEFAVDAKSLAVGPGEVRYTLVTTSPAGARNISYEGIRCTKLEVGRYAIGHADGKWSTSRQVRWAPIDFRSANLPQAALAREFMCLQGTVAGRGEEILDRIRHNRPLEQNTYKPL